jgi:hypothetical protein
MVFCGRKKKPFVLNNKLKLSNKKKELKQTNRKLSETGTDKIAIVHIAKV